MKRKLLSALLGLALCASLLPAAAAEEGEPFYDYPYQTYDPDTTHFGLSRFADGEEITVLPKEYDYIGIFRDGTAIVQKNTDTYGSTFGLVDYNGNFILPVEYCDLSRGSYDEWDNILRARKRDEDFYRYLRPDGTPLTDFVFTECEEFCRIGVGKRSIGGREVYGAVNAQGETIIPFEYDHLSTPHPSYYNREYLTAQKGDLYGAFGYDGSLLRRCIYPSHTLLLQSLLLPAQMTEEEELSHLISSAQSWEVAHAPYDATLWGYSFQRDTAQGTETCWAIYPQFLSAQPFDETGHAQVTDRDGRVGTIDQSGNFTPAPLNDRFSDVLAGSWYDKGVTTCAEQGVMVGTGEGRFSPSLPLTEAECLTMALRLYDLQRGGDGTLEKTPEGYGYMTLTLSDGKTFYRYGEYTPFFNCHVPDDGGAGTVYVQAPGETPEEREAYAEAHEGKATFTAEGKTYSGTVTAGTFGYYYGPCLLFAFDCPEAERPDLDELFRHDIPAPDKWYRDAVYTARQWGLDSADGFDRLVDWCTYQPSPHSTSRSVFARALAVAAGELPKKYDMAKIPDVERAEYNEYLYGLYEAGILNGTDAFGTFRADKELTRAECAVMVSRVLDPDQRLTEPPATPNGYEQAVIDLRSGFTYMEESEKVYETPECTVFVYDRGGAMYAPLGNVTLIYKPGSALGEGTTIRCPIPNPMSDKHRGPPELMDLSEDGKTFTYTYYYEDHVHTCTVDLPSGKTTESDGPLTYENQMAFMTQSTGYTVDQRLDGPTATVVARHRTRSYWSREEEREVPFDDYELYLLSQGQNAAHRLVLPSTAYISGYYGAPTDRLPDSMYFSEDGKTFTYTYSFDAPLSQPGGEVLHEAGDYTYTVNVTTGEVSASIDPLSQLSLSFYALGKTLRNEEGYQFEHVEAWGDSATALLRFKAASPNDPQKRDYELYLLRRATSPQLIRLPLPSTEVLPDGSAPTTAKPDTLQFSSDGSQLAYTYRFTQPLWSGDTLLHDKGTYTYTVNVATGNQSVVLEDSYWKALADLTWNSDDRPFQLERQLETEACTIVLGMTKAIQYPRAILALVYKEGSAKGSGEVVYLPTLSGGATHDSMAPHSLSLNEEKTVLTYTYQFDEDFKATRPPGGFYFVSHKAGTYTYTVDLAAGTVEETIKLKEE